MSLADAGPARSALGSGVGQARSAGLLRRVREPLPRGLSRGSRAAGITIRINHAWHSARAHSCAARILEPRARASSPICPNETIRSRLIKDFGRFRSGTQELRMPSIPNWPERTLRDRRSSGQCAHFSVATPCFRYSHRSSTRPDALRWQRKQDSSALRCPFGANSLQACHRLRQRVGACSARPSAHRACDAQRACMPSSVTENMTPGNLGMLTISSVTRGTRRGRAHPPPRPLPRHRHRQSKLPRQNHPIETDRGSTTSSATLTTRKSLTFPNRSSQCSLSFRIHTAISVG